jgi:hypothetical protein
MSKKWSDRHQGHIQRGGQSTIQYVYVVSSLAPHTLNLPGALLDGAH